MVKIVTVNRKAHYDYEILSKVEAGMVLTGTEIKSVRAGQVTLRDAYARSENGEMWLHNAHIAFYKGTSSEFNHLPYRPRKLLLHRKEINRLGGEVAQKGLTIVALRLYISGHLAKIELALVRGRRKYDKRQVIMRREQDREIQRAIKTQL